MSKKGGQKPGLEQPSAKPAAKASPANAWNRPLKARAAGPPPGMGPPSKANANRKNDAEMNAILRDRLLHLALTLVGQDVILTQTNGSVMEGVFHTFTPFFNLKAEVKNNYALKYVRVTKPPTNGEKPVEDGSTVIISVDKVVYVHAKNVSLYRPATNGGPGFTAPNAKNDVMTDSQISGSTNDKNLELVSAGSAWTTGGKGGGELGDDKGGMTRAAFGTARAQGLKGAIGQWDQFKANEELFNVQASYDENLYTTELDKSQVDKKKLAEAERIAKEIEGTTSTNIHIAEERGHAVETDFDEEDRYSGVLTKDGKQRHDATKAAAPKMNYAAAAANAAAKAEPVKKVVPPGFTKTEKPADDKGKAESTSADAQAEDKPTKTEGKSVEKTEETKKSTETKKEESKDGEGEKDKTKSKLNANAKTFTFNPSAKSFTPGGGSNFAAPASTQPHHADPNAQMHGMPMQPPQYMHPGPMGQPGMMPMMNPPQFQGMRYAPQYQSMDPQMAAMQSPQPQHAEPAPAATPAGEEAVVAGAPAKPGEGEPEAQQQQADDSSQQSQRQQQFQQMQYNVPPPGAYYGAGGMQMHPRGPQYPGQFVGNPQQIPVVPAGTRGYPVYPMQPGGMPPNMHVRGPNGNPYYGGPGGAPPGPYGGGGGGSYGGHGMMEDGGDPNFRGGRGGRGPGRGGRGRRNGRGRGRGGYNGGRGSSQQNQGSNDSASNGNGSKQQSTDGK